MLYLGQLRSKPRQRYVVVLRAGDGESSMKNGTVPPIGYFCPCTLYIYYSQNNSVTLRFHFLVHNDTAKQTFPTEMLFLYFISLVTNVQLFAFR